MQFDMLAQRSIAATLLASALVAALAVSSQSYWIDEALSVIVAQAPTPTEAWKYMQAVSGSTLQMPLYQLYIYGWQKIFGSGEWVMRASNIPWFVLGQGAFVFFLRARPRLALTACLLAAVSPMLWVYLDETRPYIMQYASACWLVSGLAHYTQGQTRRVPPFHAAQFTALCAAFLVLFSSSLLGAIWAIGLAAGFVWLKLWGQTPHRDWRFPVIAVLAGFATLLFACYYLLTWGDAKRGYHLAGASLLSVPFVVFEMLGFSGLGPGKNALRAESFNALIRTLPALAPLAIALCGLAAAWVGSMRMRTIDRRAFACWLLALALPAAVILFSFFFQGHRPLPRHFIPALPAVLLALAALMNLALLRKSFFWRACAILLPTLWLASSLSLRWQPIHAKDDYRSSAAIAAAALRDGKEVWWAADPAAAHVYRTPIAFEEIPGRAWATQAPAWESIRGKFPPDMIVLSRPDVYDPTGAVKRYAMEQNFIPIQNLTGIVVFARQGSVPGHR